MAGVVMRSVEPDVVVAGSLAALHRCTLMHRLVKRQ